MFRKFAISACAAASLTIIPAQLAPADQGAAVGGIIVDQVHKKKQAQACANARRTRKTYEPSHKRKASYQSFMGYP